MPDVDLMEVIRLPERDVMERRLGDSRLGLFPGGDKIFFPRLLDLAAGKEFYLKCVVIPIAQALKDCEGEMDRADLMTFESALDVWVYAIIPDPALAAALVAELVKGGQVQQRREGWVWDRSPGWMK